jgi:valyl-tRNA synthetase
MAVYKLFWDEFSSWYLEFIKPAYQQPIDKKTYDQTIQFFDSLLKLLHPFMPFITEELWQNLNNSLSGKQFGESIMIAAFPEPDDASFNSEAERVINSLMEIIHVIRNTRAQYKVEMNKWIESQIYAGDLTQVISPYIDTISTLARTKPVSLLGKRPENKDDNTLVTVLKDTEVYILMSSVVDLNAERQKLEKESEQTLNEANRLENRLNDNNFLTKAPTQVVEKEKLKLIDLKNKLLRLKDQLDKLKGNA